MRCADLGKRSCQDERTRTVIRWLAAIHFSRTASGKPANASSGRREEHQRPTARMQVRQTAVSMAVCSAIGNGCVPRRRYQVDTGPAAAAIPAAVRKVTGRALPSTPTRSCSSADRPGHRRQPGPRPPRTRCTSPRHRGPDPARTNAAPRPSPRPRDLILPEHGVVLWEPTPARPDNWTR
jgi:hypothetical protein